MKLREDIEELMDRTIRFTTNGKGGEALVMVNLRQETRKVKGLDQWNFPGEMTRFLDENIMALEYAWQKKRLIPDDSIPALYPRYGIAEHSAFVGGKVEFSEDTSWHHAIVKDYTDLDRLELSEDNIWLRMVIDGLAYYREKGEGVFAVKQRGSMAPLDLANALRGNDLFMDFYDHPEELHKLLRFCTEACDWYISRQRKVTGDFYGGTISGTDVWMQGNAIGHLSEDASVMCSPEIFSEFGKPYTAELVKKYDSAFMHLHTAGVQAFKEITDLEKLQYFELAPDPNQPRGIDVYTHHKELFGDRIMKLFITFNEIKENLEFLKTARTVLICDAGSVEEAQSITEFVRRELPVS